ncbi:MAG: bifunctional sugar-1-phosphate nucleotidylyltransferase/acetyltransferase [Thermoplasmata archaeon]
MTSLRAVVLAAGEGTRLGPFTRTEPKVMIPVGNRPIVEYVVRALVENGLRDIVMVVGYRKERIMTHFGDGKEWGASIEYVTQDKQLGTAHALLQAAPLLEDDFLVLPGDNVIDAKTVGDALGTEAIPSVVITESEEPSKYGVVSLDGSRVRDIVEKPEERIGNLINTGIYRLDPSFLQETERQGKKGVFDIPAILQQLARGKQLTSIPTEGAWIDAVYPWDLIKVNAVALQALKEQIAGKVEEGVILRGPVALGEGSILRAGAYIQGPVAIGEGCEIGPHATIYPSTSIGANVTIGASSVIEESLVMPDCSLGAFSYVSHSVMGRGIRSASHLSAPAEDATIRIEEEWHEVPLVGSFLGEDCVLGSGINVMAGTVVGARTVADSGSNLRGNVPDGARVT